MREGSSGKFVVSSLPTLLPMNERPTVGILATRHAQWSWIAQSLGFRIAWVHFADMSCVPNWLRRLLPDTSFTSNHNLLTPVTLILCENKVPVWLSGWSLSPVIVSLRSPTTRAPWYQRIRLQHSQLGGLTARFVTLHCIMRYKPAFWSLPPLPTQLPTSVHSVAGDTVDAGKPCRRPHSIGGDSPTIRHLGGNVYHGGGLHPWSSVEPRFVLRSVFSPSGWCRRTLTDNETLMVMDVPQRVVDCKPPSSLARQLAPGRCLQLGLRQFLESVNMLSAGGDFLTRKGSSSTHLTNKNSSVDFEVTTDSDIEACLQRDQTRPAGHEQKGKMLHTECNSITNDDVARDAKTDTIESKRVVESAQPDRPQGTVRVSEEYEDKCRNPYFKNYKIEDYFSDVAVGESADEYEKPADQGDEMGRKEPNTVRDESGRKEPNTVRELNDSGSGGESDEEVEEGADIKAVRGRR